MRPQLDRVLVELPEDRPSRFCGPSRQNLLDDVISEHISGQFSGPRQDLREDEVAFGRITFGVLQMRLQESRDVLVSA